MYASLAAAAFLASGLPPAAFGGIFLDPAQGRERFGAHSAALRDCSDETLYCLRGDIVRLVIPRACADWRDGGRWSKDGVTTHLRKGPVVSGHHLMNQQQYYGGSPERPHTIYVLSARGVEIVFHDAASKENLWGRVEDGSFDTWFRTAYLKRAGPQLAYPISSYQPLFPCR